MAVLDNAIWLTGTGGSAVSGSTVITDGAYNTTVTGTFTANAWDASQSGTAVSEFGAFGITEPITANYQFSTPVEDLTFDFQHVNSSGTTNDDMFTVYAYDEFGNLLDSADVIAGLTGLFDETVTVNPDGSVSIEADGGTPNNVNLVLPGKISELNIVFDVGPDGTETGGAGLGDFSFSVPPADDIVEGSAGADLIDASYVGDPENDRIDNSDSTGAQTGNPGSNDDYVQAGAGNDTVVAGAGDDQILGGTGDDLMFGQDGDDQFRLEDTFGNDTIIGGEGTETGGDTLDLSAVTTATTVDLTDANPETGTVSDGTSTASFTEIENITLGGGRDTIVLADGSGADVVSSFDMTDSGDGTTNDQLDVSGMTDAISDPVNAWDVIVTDTNGDGSGDAILTFPNGESITLVGVTPSQVDSAAELHSIGVPCFTPGSMITTQAGEVPVENLQPGDRVLTADNGYQPLRWVGSRTLDAADLDAEPNLRPIVICKHAFGNQREMRVSPQHGMILRTDVGYRLIRAKHVAEIMGDRIARFDTDCTSITYIHLMFDQHDLVYADGALTEAFYPGPMALKSLNRDATLELLLIFPELGNVVFGASDPVLSYGCPARPYLRRRDVVQLAK